MDNTAKKQSPFYWVAAIGIAAGLVLSIISFARLCSQECAEGHNYHFFGLPLDPIGIAFFLTLGVMHYYLPRYPSLKIWIGLMIAGAIGSEIVFVYIQYALIKHWCPVCLSILGSLVLVALAYAIPAILESIKNGSSTMHLIKRTGSFAAVLCVGFIMAFFGMAKIDPLAAAEKSIKESLFFGDPNSPIEVYVFTDWQCPACRSIETRLEKMAPAITKNAKLVFVDFTIHPESLNFTPYNISFMVNNKDQYWELRHALTKLSTETTTPTEKQVEKLAAKAGVTYQELNFADTALGMKYFKQLGQQFQITGTPTVVIVNRTDKKGKKLVGVDEITEAKVLSAIDKLKG